MNIFWVATDALPSQQYSIRINMLRFLQINLRKSKAACDLLQQVAAERKADVSLITEQPSSEPTFFQDTTGRDGIIMHNKKLKIQK